MFVTAASALSFLGAVSGGGVAAHAWCRRGPDDRFWIEIAAAPSRVAPLVATIGGRSFALDDGLWLATLPDGDVLRASQRPPVDATAIQLVRGARVERLAHTDWPEHDLRALLAETPLRPVRLRPRPEVVALVPPGLARWVLGRSVALGLDVALAPAQRRPLLADAPVAGAVWMHLRAPTGNVPAAWIAALADLPGALIAYSATERGRLLVDVRCAPPVVGPLLDALGPDEETWVLGAPDAGHARVHRTADLVDGASLMPPPIVPDAPPPSAGPASLPVPTPVRLVGSSRARPTDALLLDAKETGWLTRYLRSRPLGEALFVIGRGDVCLLLAPGGLAAQIPFGTPLARIGPAGFYLAHGLDFDPPMSEAARLHAFAIDDDHVIAVTRGGAFRFRLDALAPAWTLWIGDAPKVTDVLPSATEQHVLLVAQALAATPPPKPAGREPELRPAADANEREELRRQAEAMEALGRLAEAARLRERTGDFAAAGHLYQRAAMR